MVARGAAAPCAEVISAYCSSLSKIIAPEKENTGGDRQLWG